MIPNFELYAKQECLNDRPVLKMTSYSYSKVYPTHVDIVGYGTHFIPIGGKSSPMTIAKQFQEQIWFIDNWLQMYAHF